jgi:1-acyl-sn-glycerol-3-phosphate acyltransferase
MSESELPKRRTRSKPVPIHPVPPPTTSTPIETAIPIESTAPSDPLASAAPVDPTPPLDEIPIEIEDPRAAAAAVVSDIEVDIRNYSDGSRVSTLAADTLRLVRENIGRMQEHTIAPLLTLVRKNISSDYLDPDFWKGVGMVLQYQLDEMRGFVERRVKGEYETDRYGLDQEIVGLARPLAAFLYRSYFRVTAEGLEHVPDGRVMLAANRAGLLPIDGAMIATALLEDHPSAPLTRVLRERWIGRTPGLGAALAAVGQVDATADNAQTLLEQDQPICVFPEGTLGASKPFRSRYKLASFHEMYVGAALRASAPIVPVAVIGAEEAYPNLMNVAPLAKALRLPFLPVTPFFPLLGPIGTLPLPAKWSIVFHPALDTAGLAPAAADDPTIVSQLTEQLRAIIQATLTERTSKRTSILRG